MAKLNYMYGFKDYFDWAINFIVRVCITIIVITFFQEVIVAVIMWYWSFGRVIVDVYEAYKDIKLKQRK